MSDEQNVRETATPLQRANAALVVGLNEAESLTLDGYETEVRAGVASGDTLVRTSATGTVSGEFTGATGRYALDIGYFEESDGNSPFTVLVNGVEVFAFTASTGSEQLGLPAAVESTEIDLVTGDIVTIRGEADGLSTDDTSLALARLDTLTLTAVSGPGGTVIEGTPGPDTLTGTSGPDTINGRGDDDTIDGGDGDDLIDAGAGNDTVNGGDGDDDISGDSGDDMLFGDGGDDTLSGDDGNDSIEGGDGNDTITGGDGDDTICGNAGDDVMIGGLGVDLLKGGIGNDELFGDNNRDTLLAGAGDDFVRGGAGGDTINGHGGNDIIGGGLGNDMIRGGSGDDRLFGGNNRDTLMGDAGNDRLDGGRGGDILAGGGGIDTFVFDAEDGGRDTVTDFEAGETVFLTGFGFTSIEDAATNFSQNGNAVVFQVGDVRVLFEEAELEEVVAAIELPITQEVAVETLAVDAFDDGFLI